MTKKFALIGAAGFVAPRHMSAIKHVGGDLVAALDVHDSVGILDRYFPECRFFTSPERFDRYLNRRSGEIDYVSICSPNWLHDAHCRWALRSGAHAICEKPTVLTPRNVDQLLELEHQTGRAVYPVLQLRLHPEVLRARDVVSRKDYVDADLMYVTRRGRWYQTSWKGSLEQSGGILMNLGIHFFDMACWLLGGVSTIHLQTLEPDLASGRINFARGTLKWTLSTRESMLPEEVTAAGGHAFRVLSVGGDLVDFSYGFDDLHNKVYETVVAGDSPRLLDARLAIDLVYRLRQDAQP